MEAFILKAKHLAEVSRVVQGLVVCGDDTVVVGAAIDDGTDLRRDASASDSGLRLGAMMGQSVHCGHKGQQAHLGQARD